MRFAVAISRDDRQLRQSRGISLPGCEEEPFGRLALVLYRTPPLGMHTPEFELRPRVSLSRKPLNPVEGGSVSLFRQIAKPDDSGVQVPFAQPVIPLRGHCKIPARALTLRMHLRDTALGLRRALFRRRTDKPDGGRESQSGQSPQSVVGLGCGAPQ